jgi:hypothetical protein
VVSYAVMLDVPRELIWFVSRLLAARRVLAARAPGLQEALGRALAEGTPYLILDGKVLDTVIRSVRCLGERGFALLTQRWKTLQHVTASPGRIGLIARAAFVLVLFEHKMIT